MPLCHFFNQDETLLVKNRYFYNSNQSNLLLMEQEAKYEHKSDHVEFSNNVVISRQEFDAMFKLKFQVTCMPSFIWLELTRLTEEQNSLTIYFFKPNFKRKQIPLEILRDAGHFEMETGEVSVDNKKKIEVKLTEITPEFKSVIGMIS